MCDVIAAIRSELKRNADEKVRESSKRFFKEAVTHYGVKTPVVGRIAKEHFKDIKTRGKPEVFRLCEELLKSAYMEEAGIAYEWAYFLHNEYEAGDFAIFERWVNTYVSNWAECDTLCNHAIGAFIEAYPAFIKRLMAWTGSKNRWVKRAAAVTLILPARKGMFLKDVFAIADRLLMDEDDLVRKGYGWLLKEASRKHQSQVFDYVMEHKQIMPRTALRYAIEKMPASLKQQAMRR
jgi:3-methyladenine DNA glycosylase AlkD